MSDDKQAEERSSRKPAKLWLTSGSAVMVGVLVTALALMYWPVPTRISLEAAVSRAEMTLGISPTQHILNALEVETIAFGQFSKIELHPSALHLADPNRFDMETDAFPPEAWQPLTMFGYVRITPKTDRPLVTILPQDKSGTVLGIVDPIHVREESTVILEMDRDDPRTLTIKIFGADARVIVTPTGPFEMIVDDTAIAGVKDLPFQDEPSLTFRPELPEHRSQIEIRGGDRLIIALTVSPSSRERVFAEQPIPVKELDFSRQDASGNRMTALVAPAVLRYPDFPGLPPRTIPATDFVSIQPKKIMTIKRLTLLTDKPGLQLLLDGKATRVQSGTAEFPTDHRLSKFDVLWHNDKVQSLFGVWKEIQ